MRTVPAALALAVCALLALAAPAFGATYDPLDVIPYDTWRASSSMTAADVQTFLNALPGPLKSVVAHDHDDGPVKTAAQIIWDASRAWNINPKIILATLQKEQSLLTVSNSNNKARLIKAMGCGVYGIDPVTGKTINRYPYFGNQVWNGARVLSTYETRYNWVPGMPKTVTAYKSVQATKLVDGRVVKYTKSVSYYLSIKPKNASTFALYTYTPYYPQKLVWDIYVRYFGDPHAAARLRPVYRFRNLSSGTYYYTTSEATRYSLVAKSSGSWAYGGVSFTIDTSSTANTTPLYRFRNTKTGRYTYTAYKSTRSAILRTKGWVAAGTVGYVSTTTGAPVYRMENKKTRAILYTRYKSNLTKLTTGSHANWLNKGIAFYLGTSAPVTPPVGP